MSKNPDDDGNGLYHEFLAAIETPDGIVEREMEDDLMVTLKVADSTGYAKILFRRAGQAT